MDPKETYVAENHVYCPHTGFCTRCGVHHEVATYENLMCQWASNSVPISHIRAARIFKDKVDLIASQIQPVT